jgi:hypothetical protein
MFRSINELKNYVLEANDGEIGRCKDFLFDDTTWIIRYMVADCRKWLPGRKVLISPEFLENPDWLWKRFPVNLSRQQIKESPPLETNKPVSRQYEIRWSDHYGLPQYWLGPGGTGIVYRPIGDGANRASNHLKDKPKTNLQNSQLRSVNEVVGYHVQASDGEIGHVADFFLEDQVWVLNYIMVDTRNWLPGRKVLVSPQWANSVSWSERKVFFELSKEQIEKSPEYNTAEPPDRKYEGLLHDYYGFLPYW